MTEPAEPLTLRLGREFEGRVVASYYRYNRSGTVDDQAGVDRLHNRAIRRGRVDILVTASDNVGTGLVVIEIKNTDWNATPEHRVPINLRRHAGQVWEYLDPLLDRVEAGEWSFVQGALVYPNRPADPARAALLDVLADKRGIAIVYDEEMP